MDTHTNTPVTGTENAANSPNATLLQWNAPIHPKVERTLVWYICAGIFVVLNVTFAIWTGAWSYLGIFVLCSGGYWLMHKTEPLRRTMTVGRDGFFVDKTFYRWKECTGYWMLQGPTYIELHIEQQKKLANNIIIQIGDNSVEDIRRVFGAFLPELSERRERLLDIIIRICKL